LIFTAVAKIHGLYHILNVDLTSNFCRDISSRKCAMKLIVSESLVSFHRNDILACLGGNDG